MTGEYGSFYYRTKVPHVVDDDTIDVTIDQEFQTVKNARVRLFGIDTAETQYVNPDAEEYRLGVEQTELIRAWIQAGQYNYDGEWSFILDSRKDATGKYGWFLGCITRRCDGSELTDSLVREYGESVRY
ncbi:hypothetical protein [Haloquadratum walsbyi]|jgi:hypothetical protein|uniref:TNase-like domain-containing protein n=1 Tax=Haloquadratum walsbyi J07HQW2 TaxID=1238425 RepID=U1NB70_9EURY|nr:hypothetical protein [Haloquadratum walsbyi]ERG93853.1 MAG: hypothetical protein J07HQW2_00287 [Haloquadratum walsbyi J07HQW2]